MRYPVELKEVAQGCHIYVPEAEMIKPTYERMLLEGQEVAFPFWAKIWPAARAMCMFLEKESQWIVGKHVLEMGAGIGMPSLCIAKQCKELVISDHDDDAILLLEMNINQLELQHVKALKLDWNHFPDEILAETVLLSDINYDPNQFGALLNLIKRFVSEGSTIIISTPQRIMAAPFAEALLPYIKLTKAYTIHENIGQIEISVIVLG